MKKHTLSFEVNVGDDQMPEQITWAAADDAPQDIKALLISMFDGNSLDTLKIDIWTKDFQIMQMDRFMFQTLSALAETYQKATHNDELAQQMRQFAAYFGEKTGILKPTES